MRVVDELATTLSPHAFTRCTFGAVALVLSSDTRRSTASQHLSIPGSTRGCQVKRANSKANCTARAGRRGGAKALCLTPLEALHTDVMLP